MTRRPGRRRRTIGADDSCHLAGDGYGTAEVMTWPWINAAAAKLGVGLESYPALTRWHEEFGSRPAVRRGRLVPDLAAREAVA